MKDLFSKHATTYVKFRPSYPEDLIKYLVSITPEKKCAWDCATGNGQLAYALSHHFEHVFATDISQKQLNEAVYKENITYKEEKAEESTFKNNQFDLITVAQAIHWFNFEVFYKEVYRTLKPNGIFAAIGYSLFQADEKTNDLIKIWYTDILGKYWDIERKYVDEEYKTIPFPFKEIETPSFSNSYVWSYEKLVGYLGTWSAVQHYQSKNGNNPLDIIRKPLEKSWQKNEDKKVVFPIILRVGKL